MPYLYKLLTTNSILQRCVCHLRNLKGYPWNLFVRIVKVNRKIYFSLYYMTHRSKFYQFFNGSSCKEFVRCLTYRKIVTICNLYMKNCLMQCIGQGSRICGKQEDFLGTQHSLLSQFSPTNFTQPIYIVINLQGSISRWKFITLRIQYTTLDYSQQLF
jgi:hypothetical protein